MSSSESVDLREARQDLQPLIKESRQLIGKTALDLYSQLHNYPRHGGISRYTSNHPLIGNNFRWVTDVTREAAPTSLTSPSLFYNHGPRAQPIDGYDQLDAIGASTSYRRSYYYSPAVSRLIGRHVSIPLPRRPGYSRHVTLIMHHPDSNDHGNMPVWAGISSQGNTSSRREHLADRWGEAENLQFADVDELRKRYAADYTGRLAIAGLVAYGVSLVYNFESYIDKLEALHEQWKAVDTTLELNPGLPFWAQHEWDSGGYVYRPQQS